MGFFDSFKAISTPWNEADGETFFFMGLQAASFIMFQNGATSGITRFDGFGELCMMTMFAFMFCNTFVYKVNNKFAWRFQSAALQTTVVLLFCINATFSTSVTTQDADGADVVTKTVSDMEIGQACVLCVLGVYHWYMCVMNFMGKKDV